MNRQFKIELMVSADKLKDINVKDDIFVQNLVKNEIFHLKDDVIIY